MEKISVIVSVVEMDTHDVMCGHCGKWSTETEGRCERDYMGNNFFICSYCGKRSLLVCDGELTDGLLVEYEN